MPAEGSVPRPLHPDGEDGARAAWEAQDAEFQRVAWKYATEKALGLQISPDERQRVEAGDHATIRAVLRRNGYGGETESTVPSQMGAEPRPGLHTVDLATFLAEPPRVASSFTVEGLFPVTSGVIVLAGPQKTSKTIMALQVALSVAGSNAGCLGRAVGRHGPVLFIEEEGNRDKLRERLAAMLRGLEMEQPPADLYLSLFERVQVDDPDSMALIEAEVERLRPVMVALDPLAYLHNQDENDNTAMRKVTQPLVRLAATYDLLVLILHHVAKNASEGGNVPGKRIRGAGSISAASDGNIVFNRTGPTTIRAQAEYRDADPLETFYRFDAEHMILVEEPPEVGHKVTLEQVLELVNGQVSVSVSQAMKAWGVSRNTAKAILFNAAEAGAIDHAQDPKMGHLFMALGVST